MYAQEKNLWENYERQWREFETRGGGGGGVLDAKSELPWPPHYALLFYHMAVQA